MSRSGEVVLPWGDQDRTFRLTIGQWERVQEACDAGPAELMSRMAPIFAALDAGMKLDQVVAAGYVGTWRVQDVREPIYRGLIGGGMPPTEAAKLVRELVEERPLMESVAIAYRVIHASVVGHVDEPIGDGEDDPSGEPEGETKASPVESSPSPTTTAPARSSASRLPRSASAPSGSSSPPPKAGGGPTSPRTRSSRRPTPSTTN